MQSDESMNLSIFPGNMPQCSALNLQFSVMWRDNIEDINDGIQLVGLAWPK